MAEGFKHVNNQRDMSHFFINLEVERKQESDSRRDRDNYYEISYSLRAFVAVEIMKDSIKKS